MEESDYEGSKGRGAAEQSSGADPKNMKGVIEAFPKQIMEGFSLPGKLRAEGFDSVLVAGMGGSALAGEILKCFVGEKFPVYVTKDYELPGFAGPKTLVFAISYSGDTEETIQAYRDSIRKGCRTVVIASGGKLDILARKQNIPLINVPRGMQPRMSYGYIFFSLLRVLHNSGMVTVEERELESLERTLKGSFFREKGAEMAELLFGRIPLIYTSRKMSAVGYKWKINFNENSKIHAFHNVFPEMNHNEMVGFTKLNGEYYAVILKNDQDNPRVRLRMDVTKEIIKAMKVEVTEIEISGSNHLTKIFSAIYIGDWLSYYLALKNKVDPTPVELVQKLKKRLA